MLNYLNDAVDDGWKLCRFRVECWGVAWGTLRLIFGGEDASILRDCQHKICLRLYLNKADYLRHLLDRDLVYLI